MRVSPRAFAGVTDATLASVATFLTSLVAVNLLDEAALGIYGVFFSAFVLGSVVPAQLVLMPAEVALLDIERPERLGTIPGNIGLAAVPALATMAVFAVSAVLLSGSVPGPTLWPLAVTAAAATMLSPLQDHLRRTFHLHGASWGAGVVSAVQLSAVTGALLLLVWIGANSAWVPFGALAIGNAISLALGTLMALRLSQRRPLGRTLRQLLDGGWWLLLTSAWPHGAALVAVLVIERLVGPEIVGLATAARVAARPWAVLAIGILAVVRPPLMQASARHDGHAAAMLRRRFFMTTTPIALVYLGVAGVSWPGNPMAYLTPTAYEVGGLVALSVLAIAAEVASRTYGTELMAARRERSMARLASAALPAYLIVALSAPLTQAHAVPLGLLLASGTLVMLYRRHVMRIYAAGPPESDDNPLPTSRSNQP